MRSASDMKRSMRQLPAVAHSGGFSLNSAQVRLRRLRSTEQAVAPAISAMEQEKALIAGRVFAQKETASQGQGTSS